MVWLGDTYREGTARWASEQTAVHISISAISKNHPEVFQMIQIVRCTSGYVPGLCDRTYGPHALLVGDAASHVKPISGGGLYLGLIAADICAAVAVEAIQEKDFSERFLSRYQERWEKAIGDEIYCGLKHRDVFLSLTDNDMDKIISFQFHWRKLILEIW